MWLVLSLVSTAVARAVDRWSTSGRRADHPVPDRLRP
jgi:hypothetical protein